MAELPQRTSALVDIIGSNAPRAKAQTLRGADTPISQDITDQKFAESRASVAKMFQSTMEGLSNVATAKSADLSRKGRGTGASEIAGLFESVATGVKVYQDVEAKRALAEKEKAAEESKLAMTLVNQNVRGAIQAKISELNEAINTRTGAEGVNKIRLDIDQMLAENRTKMNPSDYQELENLVVSARNSASDEYYTRAWNTQDEMEKQDKASQLATINLEISPLMAALKTARTSDDYQNGITTIMEMVVARTPGMTPRDRSVLITPLISQLAVDSASSAATVIGLQQSQSDIDQAIPAVDECNSRYGEDPNGLNACLANVQNRFPGASGLIDGFQTNSEIRAGALADVTVQTKLQQLAISSADADMQRLDGDFRTATVQSLAWKLSQGGQMSAERERIRNSPNASPQEKEALAISESWDKDKLEYNRLNEAYLEGLANQERLADKVDPTRLGDDTYLPASRNAVTGLLDGIVRVPGGAFILRPTASMAEFEAESARLAETQRQRDELVFSRQQQGFNITNPRDGAFQAPINEVIARGRTMAAQQTTTPTLPNSRPQTRPGGGGSPNFNRVDGQGRIPTQPIVPLRRLQDGRRGDAQTDMISPISGSNAIITDGYGDPGNGENTAHPNSFHSGMDIGSDDTGDVALRAMTGGTILQVADWGAFGGTVTIRTPTGHVEQYSHMRSFNVKPGQQVAPGTAIGLMGGGAGDPMAGSSTGRHVHLNIHRPDVKDDEVGYNVADTTIDPRQYLAGIQYGNANNNTQQGLPPNQDYAEDGIRNSYVQVPRSAIVLPNGFAFTGNNLPGTVFSNTQMQILGIGDGRRDVGQPGVPTNRVATAGTPQIGSMAPIARNQYADVGKKGDNYGYQELRDRPKLREAIHLVAKTLDVPGMWVADIMEAESGFNHIIGGGDGGNYKGLIQINPDWLAQNGISWSDIDSHDEVWQAQNIIIPYFKQVLAEHGSPSRYGTIEDLYAAIQGGGAMLRLSPHERTYGDSNAAFPQHMRNMGSSAGRRYRTTWEQAMMPAMPTQVLRDGDMPRTSGSWSVAA